MGEVLSLIRAPAIAFFGGFLVVGGWIWAPQISSYLPGFSSGVSSVGSGGSWFADSNRLGRPETAPVVRTCIFRVIDFGPETRKIEPSAGYFILKAGSLSATVTSQFGKPNARSENQSAFMAAKWGELASCIYAQDDRELCDPDSRAAMVEATTKFFASDVGRRSTRPREHRRQVAERAQEPSTLWHARCVRLRRLRAIRDYESHARGNPDP
jgi:hypothetical protein